MKLFCLFDKKSCEYSCVSVEKRVEIFERSLAAQVNNPRPNNLLFTNSADFDIYCLGTFDPCTGAICSDVKFVRNCSDLKERENGN